MKNLKRNLKNYGMYDINWHLLSPPFGTMVIFCIRRWQTGIALQIGPIGTLDYRTAAQV